MAKTKLSNAKLVQYGYGQVEPNHLSAQRTGPEHSLFAMEGWHT